MSETRLEKYKKYRQSINEFKSINNEPESIKERNNSIVSDKMNTTSTLPLEEVLGKIDNMSPQEKAKIVGILNDAADTSKNLKTFSEKLNKRFLLFRLMF